MLLPDPSQVDMADLGAHYDWPGDTWLRACLVMSVDGALAGPDGLSGSLSSPADRAVLAAVRSNADAYLVGAATVRAEGYRAVRAHPVHGPARVARGQLPAPVLAVVSASCRFDWDAADFPASDQPPLVLTTASAAAADTGVAVGVAGSVTSPGARVGCGGGRRVGDGVGGRIGTSIRSPVCTGAARLTAARSASGASAAGGCVRDRRCS